MNSKTKTLLGIAAFAIFIGLAAFAYNNLKQQVATPDVFQAGADLDSPDVSQTDTKSSTTPLAESNKPQESDTKDPNSTESDSAESDSTKSDSTKSDSSKSDSSKSDSSKSDNAKSDNAKSEKTMAADFTVMDSEGKEVLLSSLFGKPIVMNFWASWCPPCKKEMPDFNKVYEEMGEDITFVMIDVVDGQRETMEKGKKHVEDNAYTFPVYYDNNQDAAYVYGVYSLPTTYFIDKDGYIVTGVNGAIDEKILKQGIDLIQEKEKE